MQREDDAGTGVADRVPFLQQAELEQSGTACLEAAQSIHYDAAGVTTLLSKDGLWTLQEFSDKRVKKDEAEDGDTDPDLAKYADDDDDDDDDDDEEAQRVGTAASTQALLQPPPTSARVAGTAKSQPVLETPKLVRSGSLTSMSTPSNSAAVQEGEELVVVEDSPGEADSVAPSLFSETGDGTVCSLLRFQKTNGDT